MFQQHLNRGHRRLARMTGSREPTARELEDKLVKRIIAVGEAELVKRYNRENPLPQKRFNRQGTFPKDIPGLNELRGLKSLDGLHSLKGVLPNNIFNSFTGNRRHISQHYSNGFSDTKVVNTSIADSTGKNGTTDTAAEIGGEDAQKAVENGELVLADAPTAKNSLGLDVWCVLFPPLSIAFPRLIHA
jgi:hypothetical protein